MNDRLKNVDTDERFFMAREAFIVELGRELHGAGAPAHRLEGLLEVVSERLGVRGQFFSTPTSLICGFGEVEGQRTALIRVPPGNHSLERLVRADELAGRVARGETGVAEAREELASLQARASRYRPAVSIGALSIASACAGVFFGGSWGDVAVVGLCGVAIGLVLMGISGRPELNRLAEFIAGLFAAGAGVAAAHFIPGVDAYTVTLGGVIVLIPGLTLTLAVTELASRHLVSGTARLMHALIVFVLIGLGVALGQRLSVWLPASPGVLASPPDWVLPFAVAIAGGAFTVLFNARPRDAGAIIAGGLVAFSGARLGVAWLGPEIGAAVGALFMGLFGNAFARLTRRPAAVITIPSMMLLVPGSLGFQSVSAMLGEDTLGGVNTAFGVVLVAVSIVAGLLLAQAILPPKQPL